MVTFLPDGTMWSRHGVTLGALGFDDPRYFLGCRAVGRPFTAFKSAYSYHLHMYGSQMFNIFSSSTCLVGGYVEDVLKKSMLCYHDILFNFYPLWQEFNSTSRNSREMREGN